MPCHLQFKCMFEETLFTGVWATANGRSSFHSSAIVTWSHAWGTAVVLQHTLHRLWCVSKLPFWCRLLLIPPLNQSSSLGCCRGWVLYTPISHIIEFLFEAGRRRDAAPRRGMLEGGWMHTISGVLSMQLQNRSFGRIQWNGLWGVFPLFSFCE